MLRDYSEIDVSVDSLNRHARKPATGQTSPRIFRERFLIFSYVSETRVPPVVHYT